MTPLSPPTAETIRQQTRQSERLDTFVDGAFAFAITLLVISGASLPRSVDALVQALRGVPAFAVCFIQLVWFWHGHVAWRERFAGTGRRGLVLSLLLVFFALIFVFPLHLVYASLFNGLSDGALSPGYEAIAGVVGLHRVKILFVCYGLSYACMGGTLAVLYWSSASRMSLASPDQALGVRLDAAVWTFAAAVGLLSMLLALLAVNQVMVQLAGYSYTLLAFTGLLVVVLRKRMGRQHAKPDVDPE